MIGIERQMRYQRLRWTDVVALLCLPLLLAANQDSQPETARDKPSILFQRAASEAREGDLSSALGSLEASFEAGYAAPGDVHSNPDFAALIADADARAELRDLLRAHARQWRYALVRPDEPGEPFRVSGRVLDKNGAPIEGALIYAYQTDAEGIYSAAGNSNPRLFGFFRTDEEGRYAFETIRPASYPNTDVDQHVHFELEASGYEDRGARLGFADDPRWQTHEPDSRWVKPVTRDEDGVAHCRFDIVMQPGLDRSQSDAGSAGASMYARRVLPLLEARCSPCHFAGGKMYERLPFDEPATIRGHRDAVLRRFSSDQEAQAQIKSFLEGSPVRLSAPQRRRSFGAAPNSTSDALSASSHRC